MNVMKKLRLFKKDESGASLVEYAVALLVVAAVGVTMFSTMGGKVQTNVATACGTLDGTGTC